jgi:hypothetical protein
MQRLLTMVLSCMAFLLSGFAMTGEAAYSIEGNVLGRDLRVDGVADRAMGVCIGSLYSCARTRFPATPILRHCIKAER